MALAAGGVLALTLLASALRSSTVEPVEPAIKTTADTARAGGTSRAGAVVTPKRTPTHEWTATGPSRRRGIGEDEILFELVADESIGVRNKFVRPVLTVRCAAKTAEVFVMTYSAASFERTGRHTVQLNFDGGDAVSQTWDHSVDHDALFAPDGNALARQIADAQTMSFMFTPFNASQAIVTFSVDGLDKHLEAAARKCGWKR